MFRFVERGIIAQHGIETQYVSSQIFFVLDSSFFSRGGGRRAGAQAKEAAGRRRMKKPVEAWLKRSFRETTWFRSGFSTTAT